MRRIIPALGLALLSPLVAEFLLGDFPITHLTYLILLAPTYGGATVLIRETARRAGLGWPSIVLMALAYGVSEEGIMTMSSSTPTTRGCGYSTAVTFPRWASECRGHCSCWACTRCGA
ncbi:hypothetical protein [Nonomuraea sp. CA-141351]|uniref:hypothetical protein n=1 Tax=Nonomuraea sp. CA-141351 TaxID=3239996 RepID=UPI003D92A193